MTESVPSLSRFLLSRCASPSSPSSFRAFAESSGVLVHLADPLLPSPFVQLRAEGQSKDLVGREPHPVCLDGVPLNAGDELRFLVGVDLETALAAEYVFHDCDRRKRLQDAGKHT